MCGKICTKSHASDGSLGFPSYSITLFTTSTIVSTLASAPTPERKHYALSQ